ncbi:histidine triad nucleotide-binding protein [Campylobacter sp. MIT 99-7217]|uniref:histidine triad nucleotide-binding protein n=1 Tax=Campylobacter sp. MIT 99-7217 TaxID=535091 RepID=UPI001157C42E|nr:histidine triad nucleotide-binding protein [Campylobacter sp. MIT 99-7217]TQR34609.1 histidine triad nucleotide-binding protein [Campylobacter sp. MIT 99-7217]
MAEEKTIFELIIEGKIPCDKVFESDEFLAFKDINPKAPIHILIVPKEHFKDFSKIPPELMAKMTSFIHELCAFLDIKEFKLLTNCGKKAGQEVFHLHFHLLSGF